MQANLGSWVGQGESMSFFKKAFKFAQKGVVLICEEVKKNAEEYEHLKTKFEDKSSEDLLQIVNGQGFFSANSKEKMIAFSILKSRGYTKEEIGRM